MTDFQDALNRTSHHNWTRQSSDLRSQVSEFRRIRFRRESIFVIVIAAILMFAHTAAVAQENQLSQPASAKPQRIGWTTSRVVGSPEPPPEFKSVRVFPSIQFDHPLQITRCPGSDRLFFSEEKGRIFSVKPGADARAELFVDLPGGLTTLARHPRQKDSAHCSDWRSTRSSRRTVIATSVTRSTRTIRKSRSFRMARAFHVSPSLSPILRVCNPKAKRLSSRGKMAAITAVTCTSARRTGCYIFRLETVEPPTRLMN